MAELIIAEQATPTTPDAGKTKVYVDSVDSHIKTKDASGVIIDLTAAGSTPLKQVLVQSAGTLAGTLDSTIDYVIDGVIDMGSQSIEVPQGGLNLSGFNFDVSKLISSAAGYTMFTSPAGGSGNYLAKNLAIEVTGSGSQVHDLVSDNGFQAWEIIRVNYNNCTSLGTLDNYRQGLEAGTGRFGGTPNLILKGTWVGGFFIDTSIVRSLDSGFTGALYEAGTSFSMASRFRSNQNIDLPASASFFDFAASNFTNPSTVQITGALVTRAGAFDANDSNIAPNISASDLVCRWDGNVGMQNTFEGGYASITSEVTTTISTISTFVDLAGTWTTSGLQHFDNPSNGQLRHLGNTPREYRLTADLIIESSANRDLRVKVRKWDDSATAFVDVFTQARVVNSFSGGRDVAFFNIITNLTLDKDDYVVLQVSNETDTNNVTAEIDSFFIVEER